MLAFTWSACTPPSRDISKGRDSLRLVGAVTRHGAPVARAVPPRLRLPGCLHSRPCHIHRQATNLGQTSCKPLGVVPLGGSGRGPGEGAGVVELILCFSDWHAKAIAVHAMPSAARCRGAGVHLRPGRSRREHLQPPRRTRTEGGKARCPATRAVRRSLSRGESPSPTWS